VKFAKCVNIYIYYEIVREVHKRKSDKRTKSKNWSKWI